MTIKPLDKPGAGLPALEGYIARYLIFPLKTALTSDASALGAFESTAQKIISSLTHTGEDRLNQIVRIPRIRGLEDSSREWSIAMTVEHLIITGTDMAHLIQQLATHTTPNTVVRIEDVKPPKDVACNTLVQRYQDFVERYTQTITPFIATEALKQAPLKHAHPWFGPINAHQWHCLNAMHHDIHWQQLLLINASIHA